MKFYFALVSVVSVGSLAFVACSASTGDSTGSQGGQQPTSGGTTANPSGGTNSSSGGATNGSGGSGMGGATGSGGSSTASGGRTTSGGSNSSGGSTSAGGSSNRGGSTNSGGASSGGKASSGGSSSASGGSTGTGEKFSFFVTSIGAMRELSGSQDGFGGDLRFGEADGLAGADKICKTIAEKAMPGAGAKTWRAFLSTVKGPVNAIDRVGEGPWYDRLGRIVAMTKADLLNDRPKGADPAIIDDLPNENGIPNHSDGKPGCTGNSCPDNHDVLTGTGPDGKLHSTVTSTTCNDWTSAVGTAPSSGTGGGSGMGTGGRGGFPGMFGGNGPWCGHSWPRMGSGVNWMSSIAEGGCAPGVNLAETGGPQQGVYTVGTGGGYGAIYCFALTP